MVPEFRHTYAGTELLELQWVLGLSLMLERLPATSW